MTTSSALRLATRATLVGLALCAAGVVIAALNRVDLAALAGGALYAGLCCGIALWRQAAVALRPPDSGHAAIGAFQRALALGFVLPLLALGLAVGALLLAGVKFELLAILTLTFAASVLVLQGTGAWILARALAARSQECKA
jgi:hypothetical protein